jgi:DNA-binding Xre family transcriptional regulator
MAEFQKNIVNRLLKEKNKNKEDLAKFLHVNKNSLNRMLKNPNISFLKLENIAKFLEIDVSELLSKKNTLEDPAEEYYFPSSRSKEDIAITNLSEVLKRNSHIMEIMAETEKRNVINIENLVKIIAGQHSNP